MTMITSRLANFIPDKIRVKLKWHWGDAQDVGISPWVVQFSGNSPWDPDVTGIGTTANMWTTFSNLYSKYSCYFSNILAKIQLYYNELDEYHETMYSLQAGDGSLTVPPTYDWLYAQQKRNLRYKRWQWFVSTTGAPSTSLKLASSTKSVWGEIVPAIDTNIDTNSDPPREWIFQISIFNQSVTGGDTNNYELDVWMHYWVTFEKPKAITDY